MFAVVENRKHIGKPTSYYFWTSEKKLQARKIKDTFISLLHTQCVLASGKSGCKTTAHKRDFDVGDGEEGALCKKRQQCH